MHLALTKGTHPICNPDDNRETYTEKLKTIKKVPK
jgi:hypothetical protein